MKTQLKFEKNMIQPNENVQNKLIENYFCILSLFSCVLFFVFSLSFDTFVDSVQMDRVLSTIWCSMLVKKDSLEAKTMMKIHLWNENSSQTIRSIVNNYNPVTVALELHNRRHYFLIHFHIISFSEFGFFFSAHTHTVFMERDEF